MHPKPIYWLAILLLLMIITGCQQRSVADGHIRILLDWTANTNHIGIFLAQELGYFEEEGLMVDILLPPESGGLDFLLLGHADLMISDENMLLFSRYRALSSIAVASILQQNDSALVALASSGITRPRDLVGRRYLGYGAPNELAVIRALMRQDGVVDPVVTEAASGALADLNALIHGEGDYLWLFKGWDVLAAELAGIELSVMMLRDFDEALNYYTPMILTTEPILANRWEDLQRAMQAIARGYLFAATYPQEAAEIFLQMVPGLNREVVIASTHHLAPLFLHEDGHFGIMQEESFARYLDWAREAAILPEGASQLEASELFTNSLLEAR